MDRSPLTRKEFSVRFAGRLTAARLAPPTAPLPLFQRPTATLTLPLTPPPSANLWETAAGKEIAADRERIQTTLASLRQSLDELRTKKDAQLGALRNVAVELSLTIATQLLHRVVTAEEFPVENMVRDMAAQLGSESRFTVHLHPDDLKLLEKRLGGEPLLPDATARLVADANLKRCEGRVEGGDGTMLISDAARQLQEIREELLRNLANDRNTRA
jgi:flagellar biosynthesis/type III secretory pathway protein FliH